MHFVKQKVFLVLFSVPTECSLYSIIEAKIWTWLKHDFDYHLTWSRALSFIQTWLTLTWSRTLSLTIIITIIMKIITIIITDRASRCWPARCPAGWSSTGCCSQNTWRIWPARRLGTRASGSTGRLSGEYWTVIGQYWSPDLNTGFWLVNTSHVTWILDCDWSILITWLENWPLIGLHLSV